MRHRVGFLTVRDHPLLPSFLDELATAPDIEPVLILDAKPFLAKDAAIFHDRTRGAFPRRPIEPLLEGLAIHEVSSHGGPETRALVAHEDLDLLVNAGTPRILGPDTLDAVGRGVLNAHPGILPKYRGASACEWALYNGDPVGVTAHFMDRRIDGGPILFTRELRIRAGMSYTDVRVALYRLAHRTRIEAVRHVMQYDLRCSDLTPQEDGEVLKPIPDALLEEVKARLATRTVTARTSGESTP